MGKIVNKKYLVSRLTIVIASVLTFFLLISFFTENTTVQAQEWQNCGIYQCGTCPADFGCGPTGDGCCCDGGCDCGQELAQCDCSQPVGNQPSSCPSVCYTINCGAGPEPTVAPPPTQPPPPPTTSPCGGISLFYPEYVCIDESSASVTWRWTPVVGGTVNNPRDYRFQVSTDTGFSDLIVNAMIGGTVANYRIPSLQNPQNLIRARVTLTEDTCPCPGGCSWSNVVVSFRNCALEFPPPTPIPPPPLDIFFCDSEGNPTSDPATGQIYSAIGCIPTENLQLFSVFSIRWSTGIAGGIALILIAYSGILLTTSRGDANKIKLAKELLTAVVGGLMFLIFSSLIYRTLFADLLGLANF